MQKIFETIGTASGVIMLFALAMFVGALLYEFGWVFAVVTLVSMMIICLTATAEWFYNKGKESE